MIQCLKKLKRRKVKKKKEKRKKGMKMKEKKTFFKIDDAHHNWNNFDLWSKQSYPGSTHLKTVLCLLNVSGEFCPRNVWIC